MVLSMEKWAGKVAVVTGASSGIGAAIATKLVENGLKVVGLARRVEMMVHKAHELANQKGKLYAIQTDVTKEEDIKKALQWVIENLGPFHILINSAGINKLGSIFKTSTDVLENVVNVNVIGLVVATREAVKIMCEHKIDGHIIHINSIMGHSLSNSAGSTIYPATKHAVTALNEIFRQEFIQIKSKIKTTSISPGMVATEMTMFNKTADQNLLNFYQTMPSLNAEDIADTVIFVLSTPEHVQVHEIIVKPVGENI